MTTIERIHMKQIIAAEFAVIQGLHEKGLVDEKDFTEYEEYFNKIMKS